MGVVGQGGWRLWGEEQKSDLHKYIIILWFLKLKPGYFVFVVIKNKLFLCFLDGHLRFREMVLIFSR